MSFMRHINLVRKMSFDDAALASHRAVQQPLQPPAQQQQLQPQLLLQLQLQQLQPAQQLQLQLQQQQQQQQSSQQQQLQLPQLQNEPFQHQGENWIPQSMLPVSPAPRHGTGHGNTYVSCC
jgi:hypothetical protein